MCKHIHGTPDLRLFSSHLCRTASVCWCVVGEIWKEKKSDIKRGRGKKERNGKLSVTIPNRWEEVLLLLWKQVYIDTLSEVQRSGGPRRVIPQTAEFLVVPTFKNLNADASPIALSCETVSVYFERATTGVGASERLPRTKASLSSVSSRPGAVCQSPSEYTLHWLEHLEVCSSLIIIWWQKSAGEKKRKEKTLRRETQFLSNGRR